MPLFHFVSIYIVPIFLDYHIEGTSLSVFIQKKGKKRKRRASGTRNNSQVNDNCPLQHSSFI